MLMLESGGAIAVSIDGNGRRVAVDPYEGAIEAVLECSANLACVGAEPLGLTNCLNFGNPRSPTSHGSSRARWPGWATPAGRSRSRWWAATCPCTTRAARARSTRRRWSAWSASCPTRRGPAARLRGRGRRDRAAQCCLGALEVGSELAKLRGDALEKPCRPRTSGRCGRCTPPYARAFARALRSAHDIAEGGLAVALAECCIAGGLGARVALDAPLFAEGGAFVVSGPRAALARFGAAATEIGEVGGDALVIDGELPSC